MANQFAGCTIGKMGNQTQSTVSTWGGLVYEPGSCKIYCDTVSVFPTPGNLAAADPTIISAVNRGMSMWISFRPSWVGTSAPANSWPTPSGNVYPSSTQVTNDANGMIASIEAIAALTGTAGAANIGGVCFLAGDRRHREAHAARAVRVHGAREHQRRRGHAALSGHLHVHPALPAAARPVP